MQATLFMSLGVKNYSQWFKGESNKVSDALSRDDDRDGKELSNIFETSALHRLQATLKLYPCPKKLPHG
jgi:hypothetical protein